MKKSAAILSTLAACAIVVPATVAAAELVRPSAPSISRDEATKQLDALQEARAAAMIADAPGSRTPAGLTPEMSAKTTAHLKAIHAYANRERASDTFVATRADIDQVRVTRSGARKIAVDYRVVAEYQRPPAVVAEGAPAIMGSAVDRTALFELDGNTWSLAADAPREQLGIPDTLDAIAASPAAQAL